MASCLKPRDITGNRDFSADVQDDCEANSTGISCMDELLRPILGRNESSAPRPIQGDTVAIQQAPEPVKKEAKKVNWCLFTMLFGLGIVPGVCYLIGVLIYAHCKDSEQETPQEPPFPKMHTYEIGEDPLYTVNTHKESLLKETNKLEEEMNTLCNQKQQLLIEREAIHPSTTTEQADRLIEINTEIKNLDTDLKKLASEWDVRNGLLPEFRKQSNSAEGLPFTIYFKGKELSQKPKDAAMVDGANNQFNTAINKKLMDWVGVESRDPLAKSIIAQSLLLELTKLIDQPVYIDSKEHHYAPRTVPSAGVRVFFESDQRLIVVRQMKTIDHDIYAWIEDNHLSDETTPYAVRHVTLMQGTRNA